MDAQELAKAELDLNAVKELGRKLAQDAHDSLVSLKVPTVVIVYALRCFEERWKELRRC